MLNPITPAPNLGLCSMRFLLFIFFAFAVDASAVDRTPNILFLFADDMRPDSIGALGNPVAKTPTLDALVGRGFVFRNAYCLGANVGAVCTPSRNMLLSGRAYFRWKDFTPPGTKQTGVLAPGEAPNLPLTFRDAGFATYHHGKKGNTATLIQAKFEVNRYLANDQAERKSGEPGREIADAAIQWLRGRKDERPFLMYLAFANPHDPRVAAEKYLALYDRAKIPLPKNFLPLHPFNNGDMEVRDEKLLPWPRTEEAVRGELHAYYATISGLDFHMGRILDALQKSGQLDNTIVVFAADHGIALGSHGLLGKQSLYDAAMKAPLILAGPGIRQGQSDALVYLLDIYPTLCDYAGVPPPKGIDGVSFRAVMAGRADGARDELFLSYLGVQRALRDDRWKIIRYPRVDVTQLFDLQADPDEMHDLAAEPAQSARVADMLARLKAAQAQWGDSAPLTVEKPNPREWKPPAKEKTASPAIPPSSEKCP
jgi:arylsulfatase A-like enzyme